MPQQNKSLLTHIKEKISQSWLGNFFRWVLSWFKRNKAATRTAASSQAGEQSQTLPPAERIIAQIVGQPEPSPLQKPVVSQPEKPLVPKEAELVEQSNAILKDINRPDRIESLKALIRDAKAARMSQPTVKALAENLYIAQSNAELERYKQSHQENCIQKLGEIVREGKKFHLSHPTVKILVENYCAAQSMTKIKVTIIEGSASGGTNLYCLPTETPYTILKKYHRDTGKTPKAGTLEFYNDNKTLSGVILDLNEGPLAVGPLSEYQLSAGMSVTFKYEPSETLLIEAPSNTTPTLR